MVSEPVTSLPHCLLLSSRRGGAESGREVVNTIHLRALKKEDLHSTYNCQAANDDLAPTKEAAIELDMNCEYFPVCLC